MAEAGKKSYLIPVSQTNRQVLAPGHTIRRRIKKRNETRPGAEGKTEGKTERKTERNTERNTEHEAERIKVRYEHLTTENDGAQRA